MRSHPQRAEALGMGGCPFARLPPEGVMMHYIDRVDPVESRRSTSDLTKCADLPSTHLHAMNSIAVRLANFKN